MFARFVCAMGVATVLLMALPAISAESENRESAPADARVLEAPPRASHIRFRSGGPTCMCAGGLSEAEIIAAERKREGSAVVLPNIIQDP